MIAYPTALAATGPDPVRRRTAWARALALFALAAALSSPAAAQTPAFGSEGPIPPLDIPSEPPSMADPAGNLGVRTLTPNFPEPAFDLDGSDLPAIVAPYAPPDAGGIGNGLGLGVPGDLVASPRLLLSARLVDGGSPLRSGIVWRVYGSVPGADGELPMVAEGVGGDRDFALQPGVYFVYCGFGFAASTVRVELREGLREESVVLNAGGLILKAMAEDRSLPTDDVRFDIYSLETDDRGERKLVARDVAPDEMVRLAADTYHVVSRYGEVNAQTRGDVEIKPGKLTEVTLFQRAAEVTLKLVGTPGGEAIADTSWSVLTPGGDIVAEGVGAFPSFVLASGDYTVVARHDQRVYQRDFGVETGRDAEVEVLAQD